MTKKTKLDHALALAREGYRVFPITPNSKKPPLISKWQIAATRDEKQIREWWGYWPDANIACPSDGEVRADIDPRNDGNHTWETLGLFYDIPPTRAVQTASGGAHYYYRLPEGVTLKQSVANALGRGVDIKSGAGGYCLAPGSTIDGREYTWLDRRPAALAPDWMPAMVGRAREWDPNAGIRTVDEDAATLYHCEAFLNQCEPSSVPEGERDATAYKIAAKFGDWAATYETCVEYLNRWNETCCVPPLEQSIIEEKARSGMTNRQSAIGSKHPVVAAAVWDEVLAEIITPEVQHAIEASEKKRQATIDALNADANKAAEEHAKSKSTLYYVKFDDSADKYKECAEPLIDEILDCETLSVVYGDSNSGKSFTELDKDFHIATGRPWVGYKIMKPGAVVYVAAEGGKGIHKRIRALKMHYDARNVPLVVVPCPVDLRRPDADVQPLIQLIRDVEADLRQKVVKVTLDTLSRVLAGGDENSSIDMGVIVQHADAIRMAVKAHVAFVHHTGKDASRGARGHSLLRAATDTEIEVAMVDARLKVGEIAITKQRDLESGGRKFRFKLHRVTVGFRQADAKPITTCWVDIAEEAEAPPATVSNGLLDVVDKLDAAIASECKNDETAIKEFTFDAKFVGAVMVKLKYKKLTKVQLDNWRDQGRYVVEPVVKQLQEWGKLEQREPAKGNRLARYSRTVTDLE